MDKQLKENPRFSMNKLAEYMTASPRRRRALIEDQMTAHPFKFKYDAARRILVRHFCDPTKTKADLWDAASRLRHRASGLDESQSDPLYSSALALEAFAAHAEQVRVRGRLGVPCSRREQGFEIAGVVVSVAPDISVVERGTEQQTGAIKFHFSRSKPFDTETLRNASAIMFQFLAARGEPKRVECRTVDVFGGTFEVTPRAIKDRLKNVEACCEEIAVRWPAILELKRRALSS